MSTVIVTPPGFAVRCVSSDARPLTEIVTSVDWPEASVPDAGETTSSPSRLDGSEIDQFTGPFSAVSVIVLPSSGVSTTVVGDTASVPCLGGGGGGDVVGGFVGGGDDGGGGGRVVDGPGELGDGPGPEGEAVGGPVGDGPVVGEAEVPGVGEGPGPCVPTTVAVAPGCPEGPC
jgi:hypothetical protein